MPTKNPRINITFDQEYSELLTTMAKKRRQSVSSLAKDLILEALERQEDMALSELAEARDIVKAKRAKHKDAWK